MSVVKRGTEGAELQQEVEWEQDKRGGGIVLCKAVAKGHLVVSLSRENSCNRIMVKIIIGFAGKLFSSSSVSNYYYRMSDYRQTVVGGPLSLLICTT